MDDGRPEVAEAAPRQVGLLTTGQYLAASNRDRTPLHMRFTIAPVSEPDCRAEITAHLRSLSGPTDSYYESQVREAAHHLVLANGQVAALAAVREASLVTLFTVAPAHQHIGPELFDHFRRETHARAALVPSSDEGFLIHALDSHRTLEVQAFAFQRNRPAAKSSAAISLTPATPADIDLVRLYAGDFFENVEALIEDQSLHVATRKSEVVGFGILERHHYRPECASIGMFVREDRRGKGTGTAIIANLIAVCDRQRLTPLAGCAASNSASKRTLERAGLAATGRLLRVEFQN